MLVDGVGKIDATRDGLRINHISWCTERERESSIRVGINKSMNEPNVDANIFIFLPGKI